jgi:cob(I)alamin adenosyltransferase
MGHRLSKIVTKTGDNGTTGLGDGSRIAKNDIRIEAIGTIDELNSHIGLLLAMPQLPEGIQQTLTQIQHQLFDLGGELCIPGWIKLTEATVSELDEQIEILNAQLPMLKEFILPGGNITTAQCHVARAVSRRAERVILSLHQQHPLNPHTLIYLNRLSDYLFVAARYIAQHIGSDEIAWKHHKIPKSK